MNYSGQPVYNQQQQDISDFPQQPPSQIHMTGNMQNYQPPETTYSRPMYHVPLQHELSTSSSSYSPTVCQSYPSDQEFRKPYQNYNQSTSFNATNNTESQLKLLHDSQASSSKSPNPQRVADNILQMTVNSYPNAPSVQVPICSMQPSVGYQVSIPQYSTSQYQSGVSAHTPYMVNRDVAIPSHMNQQQTFSSSSQYSSHQLQFSNQQHQLPNQHSQFSHQSPTLSNHQPSFINQQLPLLQNQTSNQGSVQSSTNQPQYQSNGFIQPHFTGQNLPPIYPQHQGYGINEPDVNQQSYQNCGSSLSPIQRHNLGNMYPVSYVQHSFQDQRHSEIAFNQQYNQSTNIEPNNHQVNSKCLHPQKTESHSTQSTLTSSKTNSLLHSDKMMSITQNVSNQNVDVIRLQSNVSNVGSSTSFDTSLSSQSPGLANRSTKSHNLDSDKASVVNKNTLSQSREVEQQCSGPSDMQAHINEGTSVKFTSIKARDELISTSVSKSENSLNAVHSSPVKLIKQSSKQLIDNSLCSSSLIKEPKTLIISSKFVVPKEDSVLSTGVLNVTGIVKCDKQVNEIPISGQQFQENYFIKGANEERSDKFNDETTSDVMKQTYLENHATKEFTDMKVQPEMDCEVSSTNSYQIQSPTKIRQRKQILIVKDIGEDDFELVTSRASFKPFGKQKHRTLRVVPNKKLIFANNQLYSGDTVLSQIGHRNLRIVNSRNDNFNKDIQDGVTKGKTTLVLDTMTGVARLPKIKLFSHKKSFRGKSETSSETNVSQSSAKSKMLLTSCKHKNTKASARKATVSPTKLKCPTVASIVKMSSKTTSSQVSNSDTSMEFTNENNTGSIIDKHDIKGEQYSYQNEEPKFICSWDSDGEKDDDVVIDTVDDTVINEGEDVDFTPSYLDDNSNDKDGDNKNDAATEQCTVSREKSRSSCKVVNPPGEKSVRRVHRTPKKFENCVIDSDIKTEIGKVVICDPKRSPNKRKSDLLATPPNVKKRKSVSSKALLKSSLEYKHIQVDKITENIKINKSPPIETKKSMCKSHGPFIRMEIPNNPSSFKIINEVHEEQTSSKLNKSQKPQTASSHISNIPTEKSVLIEGSLSLDNNLWFCVICKKHSSYKFLGDLFGPYYDVGCEPKSKKDIMKQAKQCTFVLPKNLTNDWLVSKHVKNRTANLSKSQEVWVHEACVLWSGGVYLLANKVYGLREASAESFSMVCSVCREFGANIGCLHKGCTQKFHYMCAYETDCHMDEDNFSLLCLKHKDKRTKKATAALRCEQATQQISSHP